MNGMCMRKLLCVRHMSDSEQQQHHQQHQQPVSVPDETVAAAADGGDQMTDEDVMREIEIHLNAIQLLRKREPRPSMAPTASSPLSSSKKSTNSASSSSSLLPPLSTDGLSEHPSLSRAKSPGVVARVRAGRAVRSMARQHHQRTSSQIVLPTGAQLLTVEDARQLNGGRRRGHSVDDIDLDESGSQLHGEDGHDNNESQQGSDRESESSSRLTADELRKRINGDSVSLSASDSRPTSRATSEADSSSVLDSHDADARSVSSLRQRRAARASMGSLHDMGSKSASPPNVGGFSVVVSAPTGPGTGAGHQRSRSSYAALSVAVPPQTNPTATSVKAEEDTTKGLTTNALHAHGDGGSVKDLPVDYLSPLRTTFPTLHNKHNNLHSPLGSFRHDRTPSISERLNTGSLLQRSPAHLIARSVLLGSGGRTKTPGSGGGRRRSTIVQTNSHHDNSDDDDVRSEPDHHQHDDLLGHVEDVHEEFVGDFLHEDVQHAAERVHASLFAATGGSSSQINVEMAEVEHHTSSDDTDSSDGHTPIHEPSSTSELAAALALASSTVNCSQESAVTPHITPAASPRFGGMPFRRSPAGSPSKKVSPKISPSITSISAVNGVGSPAMSTLSLPEAIGTTVPSPRAKKDSLSVDVPKAAAVSFADDVTNGDSTKNGTSISGADSSPQQVKPALSVAVSPTPPPADRPAILRSSTAPTQSTAASVSPDTPKATTSSITTVNSLSRAASKLTTASSPPNALLSSPGSAGLSSAAWLERRLRRMLNPDDSSASSAIPINKFETDESIPWYQYLKELVLSWLPSLIHVALPCIILLQVILIPMRLAFSHALLESFELPFDAFFLFAVLFTDYLVFDWNNWNLSLRPNVVRALTSNSTSSSVNAGSNIPNAPRANHPRHSRTVLWQLALDFLSSVPFECVLYFILSSPLPALVFVDQSLATPIRLTAFVRLPRLLRLTRLFSSLDNFESRNLVNTLINPTIFRLVKLGIVMYLVAHLAGTGYIFLSFVEGLPENNDWIVPEHIRSQSLGSQYLHAIYYGFCAMTNGAGTPHTPLEHVFALVVLLIGVSTYATLIGNLSSIIAQMNSKQEDFRDKMTSISSLMETYHLPAEVQHRVKSCFQYLFNVHDNSNNATSGGDEEVTPRARGEGWEVLEYLPSYLRNDVLCGINGEIIYKVPLFRGCSDGFMRSLVPLLRPEVVIPGDYIIRMGEIGREMYLIRHGELEVIAHGLVVATLSDGSYVGEVAVMFEQRRTASVRAITFCDILVLSKDDFDSVLSQYPEVQRSIKMQATMRRNARRLQDKEVRVAEIERVNNASARKLPGLEEANAKEKAEKKPPKSTGTSPAMKARASGSGSKRPPAHPSPGTNASASPPPASGASTTPSKRNNNLNTITAVVTAASPKTTPLKAKFSPLRASLIGGGAADMSPKLQNESGSPDSQPRSRTQSTTENQAGSDTGARSRTGSVKIPSLSADKEQRLTATDRSNPTSASHSAAASGDEHEAPAEGNVRTQSKWKKLRLLTRGQ